MNYIPFLFFSFIFNINILSAEENETNFQFDDVSSIKIEPMEVDIQFVIGTSSQINIITKDESRLKMDSYKGTLTVSRRSSSSNNSPKLRIVVPRTIELDINVNGKSHIFIPQMAGPIRITSTDLAQVTIDACIGLVLTQSSFAKTQLISFSGNMSATLSNKSELGVRKGSIATTLITATDSSHVSIAAPIRSLKLITKGNPTIQMAGVTDAFTWSGRGNERVHLKSLTGVADVTANYDSRLTVEEANLDTLLAATSSTGKIKILGTVKNAALSARGASEIVVDKVTGKILRKNQSNRGIIKILNP